jgi:hypothetical protein
MTNADPLPPTVLSRKAVVYVRQSTQTQVQVHLESQRRQYDLVDEARRHGFRDVAVISADLPAAPWHAQASRSSSLDFAPARSVPCFALMLPGSPATAGIGITCWSCAVLSTPASST